MDWELPADLVRWDNHIAVLTGERTSGHLLLEAVTCYGHGDGPVAELEWTARLHTASGAPSWAGDHTSDWAGALADLAGGTCPWLPEPCHLTWLTPAAAAELRDELFD